MAKIAVDLAKAVERRRAQGEAGSAAGRLVAKGRGWTVEDVLCTSGPDDRPFEERHSFYSIAIVMAGSFQYRSSAGCELLTPGSLLLGNAGDCFQCGHQHAAGDRCLAFHFTPQFFENVVCGAGEKLDQRGFRRHRIPPVSALSPEIIRASAAMMGDPRCSWEEVALELAAKTLQIALEDSATEEPPPSAVARVTRVIRRIEREPSAMLDLRSLAAEAKLSPYHFLRTFERLTGLTPHQYLLRARLREAALRLATGEEKVLEIALECGFGDVSNFNRSFRREFGVSPRQWRGPSI